MKRVWTNYGYIPEEVFRALTGEVELQSTIPTVWSPVLEEKYVDLLRLAPMGVMYDDLDGKPGDEVIINQLNEIGMAVDMEGIANVPGAGDVPMGSESPWNNTDIVETAMSTEEVCRLIPSMKFKGVKVSLKVLNRSFINTMGDITGQLAFSMASKMEFDCFEALSSGGTRLGEATPTTIVAQVMTLAMSKAAKVLFDVTVKMNPQFYFEGDTLVCLLHPYQADALTSDTDWMDFVMRQPGLLPNLFKGELFNYMGVRYVKSTMVKFYAGGALTDIAATDMWPLPTGPGGAGDVPTRRWYFQDGAVLPLIAVQCKNIQPRYQYNEFATGNPLTVTADPVTDGPYKPKVVAVNYREGWVEFDKKVGGTTPPQAVFSYGAVPVYDTMFIGRRAFAVAYKQRPQLVKEITNYGLFIGVGSVGDWDVKKLRGDQIIKTFTKG